MNRRAFTFVAALGVLSMLASGCDDEVRTFPPSLDGPRDVTIVKGQVCLDSIGGIDARVAPVTRACDPNPETEDGEPLPPEIGDIGLVASEQNNRIGVLDMSRVRPRFVDLDPSEPGVSHISVGRAPVAVAAGPGGNAGYALNQIDKTISPINLWWLRTDPQDAIELPRTPRMMEVSPAFEASVNDQTIGEPDRLIVALTRPNSLWIRDGVSCPKPDGVGSASFDRRASDADVSCTPPDDDAVTTLALADTPSAMTLSPDGDRLYVAYRDRGFMSVFGLDERATADGAACRILDSTPCEIDRIGLAAPCSDGLDNDGDGLIDQEDPQCYGPFDNEAPSAPGSPSAACSDGVDNDGDGLVDRDDPGCAFAGDDSESDPDEPVGTRACSDGADNDGDGLVDWPDDPDCYGERGRSERDAGRLGVESISVGPMDRFVYVVDKANTELLVADAQRGELIDVRRAEPGDRRAFLNDRGITVATHPEAVQGRVVRSVIWQDPDCDNRDTCSHGVVRYDFEAMVASNNSSIYTVSAATAYCEVYETDDLLTTREFLERGEAFQNSRERECLDVPRFPQPEDPNADACQAVRSCQACLGSLDACQECRQDPPEGGCSQVCAAVGDDACTEECDNFVRNDVECRTSGRLQSSALVNVAYNPEFALRDSLDRNAQVNVGGSCDTPSALLDAAREQNADPSTECAAPFRPQPVALDTPELDGSSTITRASLRRDPSLVLVPGTSIPSEFRTPDVPLDAIQPFTLDPTDDYTIRSETWTVAWEGVIPGTNRDDAIISADEPGLLEMGGADMCSLGVVAGDRLTIRSQPDLEDGPESCDAFDSTERGFLTWRVAEVRPRELKLEVIDAEDGEFADELPRRECFTRAIDYEVRPEGEWLAYGSNTGYLSPRESFEGRCIESKNANDPRFTSRVRTGEIYRGPYLSFEMRPGDVDPVRSDTQELRYRFRVEQNFSADRFSSNTIFPRDILYDPLLPGGRMVMVPDASGDFVFLRNFDDRERRTGIRLQ
ncbi:MAG: hypothetical protein ACQEVA_03630 [Myxococcota bacterium]